MVERILYINLDRSTSRNEAWLSGMEAAGVPMEIVERVPGKDWQDHSGIPEQLKAMQADGFGANAVAWRLLDHQRGVLGCLWSMCICLRKIIDFNEPTLLLHDDIILNMPWSEFVASLHHPLQVHRLLLVQLQWDMDMARLLYSAETLISDPRWCYGIGGPSERATVFTEWGARRAFALAQGCLESLIEVEEVIFNHFNNYQTVHPVNPDDFIKYIKADRPSEVNRSENSDM